MAFLKALIYYLEMVNELCTEFDVERAKKPKNLEAILAYRILGIKGNHAEEFEKANVVVKTIRIGRNNKIKESMSFPAFRFKELIQDISIQNMSHIGTFKRKSSWFCRFSTKGLFPAVF